MIHKELVDVIQESINETAIAFFQNDIGIQAGPAVIKPPDQPYEPPKADVTAVVAFSGELAGGVHLSAPLHAALALIEAFMGEPVSEIDDTGRDALGELTNMIAGAVKSRLSESIHLTPPNVVTGQNLNVSYTTNLESTKCYFRTGSGPFFVEVFFRTQAAVLLDELQREHVAIKAAFEAIRREGIGSKEGQKTFWMVEKLLVTHLEKEDEQVYPALNIRARKDTGLQELLKKSSWEMRHIKQRFQDLSNRLVTDLEDEDIEQEFNQIHETLTERMKMEESHLYLIFADT